MPGRQTSVCSLTLQHESATRHRVLTSDSETQIAGYLWIACIEECPVIRVLVDPANATRLATRIRDQGGTVRCLMYPNINHSGNLLSLAWPFRWLAPTLTDTVTFFTAHP